jgi:hypothetical protein
MLALVLQIFLGKEHVVKNRLISTLDNVSKELFFRGVQNLSSLHKIRWRSAEKIPPFSSLLLLA